MTDGIRLAALAESLPLSRASVFEIVRALGITTSKGPGPDGRGRVAWLSGAQADEVSAAAQRVHRGEVRISDLWTRPSRRTPPTLPDSGSLLSRLEAADRAAASSLGLTTAELGWIIGVQPRRSPLRRGGLVAVRVSRNCWNLYHDQRPTSP